MLHLNQRPVSVTQKNYILHSATSNVWDTYIMQPNNHKAAFSEGVPKIHYRATTNHPNLLNQVLCLIPVL